jgi:phosphoserine phosphatase
MTFSATRRDIPALLAAGGLVLSGCGEQSATVIASRSVTRSVLPSWNDGKPRDAILDFVSDVTNNGGPDYVAPEERIAVFDNDGTLWVEQPLYVEFMFVLDRAKQMMANDPGLASKPPFKALADADGDVSKLSETDFMGLLAATHSGMTAEAFTRTVRSWLASAMHPRFKRPYTSCVYQPMLELLAYLRDKGFKTFIVSGGGVDFMRAFAEATYGVPPEQVIGSSGQGGYLVQNGVAQVVKEPKLGSVDDKAGKPINIALHIGRRPIAAFGNSDGDLHMLKYVSTGDRRRFALIVHHDDEVREYAYDRDSKVGTLSAALDEAHARGWTVVSMREDWKDIFPPGDTIASG